MEKFWLELKLLGGGGSEINSAEIMSGLASTEKGGRSMQAIEFQLRLLVNVCSRVPGDHTGICRKSV